MTELQKMVVGALVTACIGGAVGYFSAREAAAVQVNRLEERQQNNFAEVMRGLADLKGDVQGVRGEIMGILKAERQ